MSILVVLLPARERAAPASGDAAAEYAYLLSADGLSVARQGRTTAALAVGALAAAVAAADFTLRRVAAGRKAPTPRPALGDAAAKSR